MLASLYDFAPESYGLPPFEDRICGELVPVEPPWTLKGTVVKGFGRGSRELGIPTANLDSASLQVPSLAWAPTSLVLSILLLSVALKPPADIGHCASSGMVDFIVMLEGE